MAAATILPAIPAQIPDVPAQLPAEDPTETEQLPVITTLGCQPSELSIRSIGPLASMVDPIRVTAQVGQTTFDSDDLGIRLGLVAEDAIPGPVQVQLTLGLGREVTYDYLDTTAVFTSINVVRPVYTWTIDSMDGGLHAVALDVQTACVEGDLGPPETIDLDYFQWDARMRCLGTDSVKQTETSGASDGPAPAQVGPFTVQTDPVHKFVIGLTATPTLTVGSTFNGALVTDVDPVLKYYAVEVRPTVLPSFGSLTSADIGVAYCDSDVGIELHHTPVNDPQRSTNQANLNRVNVDDTAQANHAWHTTLGTTAKEVCVIDTGLRPSHQEFAGPRVIAQKDFTSPSPVAADTSGHGTHVTGIALANTGNGLGIAGVSQSDIMVAKVFDATGAGQWSWVASAIQWCTTNGADVINMSLGDTSQGAIPPPAAVATAVGNAWNSGVLLVASAGNDGCQGCVTYPAKYPEVVGVGCTDNTDAVCAFSNTGNDVDIVAPGLAVRSSCRLTDSDYCDLSGTSMSAPHVAGAAALIWSHLPGLTNTQVRAYLMCGARDVGPAGWDQTFGNGVVDVGTSLERAVAGTCTPTPPPPCTGQILINGAPDNGSTYVGAASTVSLAIPHAHPLGHAVPGSWVFRASDGTVVGDTDNGHDSRRVWTTDSRTRTISVQVDLQCGATLTEDFLFRMKN